MTKHIFGISFDNEDLFECKQAVNIISMRYGDDAVLEIIKKDSSFFGSLWVEAVLEEG